MKFAFISDFDGTLTEKDFYKIITDEYLKEECAQMYIDWKKKKIKDVDYLGYVFGNIRRSEEQIYEDIMKIKLDPFAVEFIKNINDNGGDFIVVSAGTGYYIDKVFKNNHIENVKVYTNKGVFKDNGIHFLLDENSEFYSEIYGIDKMKVVNKLKGEYDKIFYAGDSQPDVKAALLADVVFAKGELIEFLKEEGKEYIEFNNFKDIWEKVKIMITGEM
ncbi:Haloacid Dehalogenase superfamily, subfamily IB, phosphoserine phosphatase-like/2,3-diketo-5-methylthio-1-phosphopentane phosphatase [Clostridium acidisoli DSM 12555]|uniref:phosphoserine phosphatase n=1 Tax=Clostridium acidisoli DSM 12555 TaxID=1121291 RepID=A0A1W1XYT7_9CLOT|nr:MtnX-like HAD-IB family phosphatase [Clostridium acidisoli]SMC29129.1 Haloacid Dehalogenase superfamily, subfamily IB, phosphoserine phosphatase-like/2,3-diketo-5-methylthio-1-phosphopentane phosphatase [Clostridium acidisoli DSM 12555]